MYSTNRLLGLSVLTGGVLILGVSTLALASDADTQQQCRAIQDAAARLACYDEMEPPLAEEAPAAAPDNADARKTSPPPATEPQQLSDEIGRESLDREDPEDKVKVRGHVVDCRTNERGRYFFFFENGQAWEQKDSKRVAWDDCDFEVTIDKDFFGYGMTRVGDDRRIRISRVK